MARWEYWTLKLDATGFWGGKVDEGELDRLLNDAGRQGWELVTAFDTNQSDGQTLHMLFTFKRPVA